MIRKVRHSQFQKGVATVEFVLTAPLLLLLLFAVAELGWAFNQYITLIKSVRDGARYAAANAYSGSQEIMDLNADLLSNTRELVVYGRPNGTLPRLPGWQTAQVSVTAYGDDHVEISAYYDYTPVVTSVIPFIGPDGLGVDFRLETATVVRAL